MELDELKNAWNEIDNQLKTKQHLNLKIFDNMSKQRFYSKLKKIIVPEILGSIVCIGCAVFICFNFDKLTTPVFQVTGITGILLLLVLPVVSLLSIYHLYKVADNNKSYAETLNEFTVQKIKFCRLQKLNLLLSYLLLVTVILLLTKLFGSNSITESKYFSVFAYSFGFCFLLFFSKWVFKNYNRTIRETEKLLNEMQS